MKYPVNNNEEQQQFEIHVDGDIAVIEYRVHEDYIAFMHTEVPEQFEGRGIASQLAEHALEWARESGKKIKVYCSFVKTYLERHQEYNDLVINK